MARVATAPARARTAPAPRTRPRPTQPRRRSGRGVPAPRRRSLRAALEPTVSRLLDALLLGRAWVILIGALLAGIVFLQVSLLGLNQGITRDAARAGTLQQQNAQLRLAVADLASSERIQQLAAKRGMVMPAPGQVVYLHSHSRADARRAAQRSNAPVLAQPATTPVQPQAPVQTAPPAPVQSQTPVQPQVQQAAPTATAHP
jgi:cell division protein FtsL